MIKPVSRHRLLHRHSDVGEAGGGQALRESPPVVRASDRLRYDTYSVPLPPPAVEQRINEVTRDLLATDEALVVIKRSWRLPTFVGACGMLASTATMAFAPLAEGGGFLAGLGGGARELAITGGICLFLWTVVTGFALSLRQREVQQFERSVRDATVVQLVRQGEI